VKGKMPEAGCLFCRVVAGEIPADFVHQDDRAVVIHDINPQAPTHLLVIPREHTESLDEASQKDEALLGHLLRVAARMANAAGLVGGYRTVINTGAGAGQSVFHLHVHVLGGRPMNWPPG
jgi:histidine triad (HIT) family protein